MLAILRRITALLALFAAVSLTGCVSPYIRPDVPTSEPWTNYQIGTLQESATGSAMVEWIGRTEFLRGYQMITPLKVERIGVQPPSDGKAWVARYTYSGPCSGGRYVVTRPDYYKETIGIIVAGDGTIPCEKPVLQIKGLRNGRAWATPDAVNTRVFALTPILVDAQKNPLRWELIYSGRAGNEMVLDYREYVTVLFGDPSRPFYRYFDLARPAFYQHTKYDLSTSNRVVFRTMELEIHEATNSGVKFRVLRDPERAVTPSSLAPRERQ